MSAEKARTLTISQAAREYGLGRDEVRSLIRAGLVWTVTIPGRRHPKVVRDGLEAWVRSGKPAPTPPRHEVAYVMPRTVRPMRGTPGA